MFDPAKNPPPSTATTEGWLEYVNKHLPYDPNVIDRRNSMSNRVRMATSGTVDELEVIQTFDDDSRLTAAEAARHWFIEHGQSELSRVKYVRQQDERIRSERAFFVTAVLDGRHGPEARKVAERMLNGCQWTDERLARVLTAVNAVRQANPTLPGMEF